MASMPRRRRWICLTVGILMFGLADLVVAQRRMFETEPPVSNAKYDGRFTFARLRYTSGSGGYYYGGIPAWAHGYWSMRGGSRAEESLMRILKEISLLNPHVEESVVLALDDPELCKYPVAYMSEAGYWTLTDSEAVAFR